MNSNIVRVTPAPDALMDRYNELAFTQEIASIESYADDWLKLARDADSAGRPALAGMARERGLFYAQQVPGEYIRLFEGSFSELIQVEPPTNMENDSHWFERQERINANGH